MCDTIFAPATPLQKSSTAIIRISGNDALKALEKFDIKINNIQSHIAYVRQIKNEKNFIIDQCIVIYFKSPNSLTGEDIIEIQSHGSLAVIRFILSTLSKIEGFRFANRGEFLQRAFQNEKMTLNQIEGLSDLFDSETEEQLKQSSMQTFGKSQKKIQEWRKSIIDIYASIVALLDLPTEEAIELQVNSIVLNEKIKKIISEIEQSINGSHFNEKIRSGFKLVLYGKTNTGKSTFINTISKRDVSIVSSIHGTTRDLIDSYIDIDGYPLIITDTAGIRNNAENEIEEIGIKKTRKLLEEADIIMLLHDNKDQELVIDEDFKNKIIIRTISKFDDCKEKIKIIKNEKYIPFSCHKNINLDIIKQEIKDSIKKIKGKSESAISRIRHKEELKNTMKNLIKISEIDDLEIMLEHIKLSLESIGRITGHSTFDEVLDSLFANFCVGK